MEEEDDEEDGEDDEAEEEEDEGALEGDRAEDLGAARKRAAGEQPDGAQSPKRAASTEAKEAAATAHFKEFSAHMHHQMINDAKFMNEPSRAYYGLRCKLCREVPADAAARKADVFVYRVLAGDSDVERQEKNIAPCASSDTIVCSGCFASAPARSRRGARMKTGEADL